MADSNEGHRKTLDEIRSELAAEYPVESEAEQASVRALDQDATAVERDRSVDRDRERRRRYAMAAAFVGITASLLLIAGYALTRKPVQRNALATAPDVTGPSAAPTTAIREPQPAAPTLPPAALVELDRQLKALRSDVKALADRLERSDSRIGGIQAQVQGVESSMRRLVDDPAAATATRAGERTVPAPRRTAKTPPAPAVAVPPDAPLTASASERWIPAKLAVPDDSPAPKQIRPAEEVLTPVEVSPPAATTSDVAGTVASAPPATLRQKLSSEWRTIKQGFATAGDDFKAVMRELGRKVTRE
jgi:hypothetical protein